MTAHDPCFEPPRGVPSNDWHDLLASLDHWLALHGMTLCPGLDDAFHDHHAEQSSSQGSDPLGGGDQ